MILKAAIPSAPRSLRTEAGFEAGFRTGAGRSLTRCGARGRKVPERGGGDPRCAKARISGAVKEGGGSGALMVVVGGWIDSLCGE